ncbi:MAG: hypothetical protein ABF380_12920 [Akkermansiaceae bacterium]
MSTLERRVTILSLLINNSQEAIPELTHSNKDTSSPPSAFDALNYDLRLLASSNVPLMVFVLASAITWNS